MKNRFIVEIIGNDGHVEKTYGPTYERKAERIMDGISINLNHDRFYMRLRELDENERLRDK